MLVDEEGYEPDEEDKNTVNFVQGESLDDDEDDDFDDDEDEEEGKE